MKTIKTAHMGTMDTIHEELSDLEQPYEQPFGYESSDEESTDEEFFEHGLTDNDASILSFTGKLKEEETQYSSYPLCYIDELIKSFRKPKTQYIFCVNEYINHKKSLPKIQAIYAHYLIENIRFLGYRFLHKMHTLHFNRKGDLLCGGSAIDEAVVLHSWPNLDWSMKFDCPGKCVADAHFLQYSGFSKMVIVTEDRELLFTSLLPSGHIEIKHTPQTYSVDHLVVNPLSENEIISVSWDKDIHLTDTRDSSSYVINKNSTDKIGMLHVAHHPFQPEICVCGENHYTYVYDKRKMVDAIHKVGPNNVNIEDFYADTCEYNYLGTEILINYNKRIADVYENICSDTPRKYLHRVRSFDDWNSANFMGFTSEYIVTTHGGLNGKFNHIYFWDKKTEALVNFHYFSKVEQVAVHPNEYVVAFTNKDFDVELLFPSFRNDKPLTLESMLNRYGPSIVYDKENCEYSPFVY